MPKERKESSGKVVHKELHSRREREQRLHRIIVILSCAIVVVVLGLMSYALYDRASDQDREKHQTVLKVNDQKLDISFYARMLRLYGITNTQDPSQQSYLAQSVEQLIERNETIRQLAPALGVTVSDAELDAEIERQFTPPADAESSPQTISYNDFLKRLKGIDVSENDFRGQVEAELLTKKVQDFIGTRDVPDEAPQAHVNGILIDVSTQTTGTGDPETVGAVAQNEDPQKKREIINARLKDGEGFATLAAEFSQDSGSKEKGGDLGWFSRELANLSHGNDWAETIFSLSPGTLSEPVPASNSETNTRYWLVSVPERADARILDETQRATLENQAFTTWFEEQSKSVTVENLLTNPDVMAKAIEKALS